MEAFPRFSNRLFSLPTINSKSLITPFLHFHHFLKPISNSSPICPYPFKTTHYFLNTRSLSSSSSSSTLIPRAGWLLGLGEKKQQKLPDLVKAGDPVLHEAAREVDPKDIGSEKIQKIIDDMIKVMKKAPGVGLAAPQIGIPLKIIVLEDTKEYISYAPKGEIKAQDRRPFDLLVIVNPVLKNMSDRTALFFEGCLSVDGYRAVVERYLDVEVSGLDRYGQPVKVDASGWQARILQHECDHLEGTLYVDKMVQRTFRTVENLDLPLAVGCPKLGAR
ncbi:peptide deformylase 1A, chloroplastic/mitochondrial [Amaranthus tricolor]|uniref:peptide deformylase 1A, chloroplastic/mitochondrial n=1 Tax=Amaranthus tricolor TaxID=29722 RepID=UPI002588F9EE|nr:peptide deformylase 1A, chloroplastic/mitochondrial [Amaranthus tricolor]